MLIVGWLRVIREGHCSVNSAGLQEVRLSRLLKITSQSHSLIVVSKGFRCFAIRQFLAQRIGNSSSYLQKPIAS